MVRVAGYHHRFLDFLLPALRHETNVFAKLGEDYIEILSICFSIFDSGGNWFCDKCILGPVHHLINALKGYLLLPKGFLKINSVHHRLRLTVNG